MSWSAHVLAAAAPAPAAVAAFFCFAFSSSRSLARAAFAAGPKRGTASGGTSGIFACVKQEKVKNAHQG